MTTPDVPLADWERELLDQQGQRQQIRQQIARDICEREGDHGPMVDTTAWDDMPFRSSMCNRSCGARIYAPYDGPLTVEQLQAFLAKREGQQIRIMDITIEERP